MVLVKRVLLRSQLHMKVNAKIFMLRAASTHIKTATRYYAKNILKF